VYNNNRIVIYYVIHAKKEFSIKFWILLNIEEIPGTYKGMFNGERLLRRLSHEKRDVNLVSDGDVHAFNAGRQFSDAC
jgi:hypothetical protein